jgi:hypothetical protein
MPLAGLVLLITFLCALLGVLAASDLGEQGERLAHVLTNALVGALGGVFLGGGLAVCYEVGIGGVVGGGALGLATGAMAGAASGLALHPGAAAVGAGVVVGLAVVVRVLSSGPRL